MSKVRGFELEPDERHQGVEEEPMEEYSDLQNEYFEQCALFGSDVVADQFQWLFEHGGLWMRDQEEVLEALDVRLEPQRERYDALLAMYNESHSEYHWKALQETDRIGTDLFKDYSSLAKQLDESMMPAEEKIKDLTIGEQLINMLRSTVDKLNLNELVTVYEATEDLFTEDKKGHREINWGHYVTASLVIASRLKKRTRPRAGWQHEVERLKKARNATRRDTPTIEDSPSTNSYSIDMESAIDLKRQMERAAHSNDPEVMRTAFVSIYESKK